MSKRTKFLLGIGVIAALVIGWQVAAYAVHDLNVFELEGNALDDPVAGDDWENVAPGGTQNVPGAGAKSFTEEEPADASTIFTGGGSKDPIDISSWKWKNGGGLPDKDNLLHSFAARYTVDGEELLYFGSDRFDNSGDAVQGFWFLQNEVTPLGTNGGGFDGLHSNGDLLILSDFSNGGDVSTINVYEWDERCDREGQEVDRDNDPDTTDDVFVCGDANLLLLASSEAANCADISVGAEHDFCGIVNPNTIELPWTFTDKSGTTFDHDNDPDTDPIPGALNGEFFEGGINLTALGLGERCFSTVISETRSSTSTTAVLKDFVVGTFDVCEAALTTQTLKADGPDPDTNPDPADTGTVTPGTPVFDTATVTVTGATNPDDPTGTVKFFLCGPGQANPVTAAGCPATPLPGGTQIGTPLAGETLVGGANTTDGIATATSEAVNTATSQLAPGKYCFRAEYSGDADNDQATHTNTTTECFTVQDTSSLTTSQSWIPNDTATITTQGSSAIDGDVVFKLYDTAANCTANGTTGLLYSETQNDVTGASGSSFSTNNDGDGTGTGDTIAGYSVVNNSPNAVTTTGPLYWRVTYTPNATAGHTGSDSLCKEQFTITSDNDNTTAPPPTP